MVVGVLKLLIFISSSGNLKEKRMVLRSLKDRLRSNFNVSVVELGDHEKWQRSTLALAAIGKDRQSINSLLSNIINFLEKNTQVQLLDYEMEMI